MSRAKCQQLVLLLALACSQASGPLWAQSFGTISTVAGNGNQGFSGDLGPATQARLFDPADVAVSTNGDLYIADTVNNRIRKVDASGRITTIAGTGNILFNGDSIPATAANLFLPAGIAFDLSGDLYISDTGHNRIRRVDAITGIITTVAGTGESGKLGDNGPATDAQLSSPYHIAFDAIGNLYIADSGNHEIRRVLANNGNIETFAGIGQAGDNGDNQSATAARLNNPRGILIGATGDVYIGDFGNHRVRRVDQGGFIRAFAGTGATGSSGDGGPAMNAQLKGPVGLGKNAAGDIFIADSQDNRVRQVNILTGIIITVAGNGQNGYSGDGGPAEDAQIAGPSSVFDSKGRLYIAQFGSDVIRAVDTRGAPTSISVAGGGIQTTAAGTAFAQPLVALVRDANGIPLPGVQVTFSEPSSGATATLSPGRLVTTDDLGKASVNATANTVVGSYLVLAAAAQLSGRLAGFDLTNTAGVAATIEFVVQPTDTLAGTAIAPPVKVRLKDANGNPVAGAQVSLGGSDLQSGGGFQTTDSSGVVTYGNLKYETAGTHQLSASGPNTAVSSNPFRVTAGSAAHILTMSGQDQTASVNATYAVPLKALLSDAFGNGVAGISVTFTAPSTGPSVTFSSTATALTNAFGIATAPQMTANSQTGPFEVTAAAPSIQPPAVFALTNVAGAAARLAFVQQPTDTVAGATMTPAVTVQLQDSFGNNVTTAGVAVTLQANPVAGRAAGFSVTQNTNLSGIATFSTLTFSQVGQFTMLAEANLITSATSTAFTIRAGVPAKILTTGGTPQTATILSTFAQPLKAKVLDAFDNPISGITVTFTAPSSGASASLTAPAITDATGQCQVTATANNKAGLYSVTAATAGVSPSSSFSLTNVTGSVGRLEFAQQPTNVKAGAAITPAVAVHVYDAGSNPIPNVSVSIHLSGSAVALGGTLSATTNTSGLATFADLNITTAGSYLLEALSSGKSKVSSSFNVTAATSPLTIIAFEGDGQTAAVGAGFPQFLRARVEDPYHNPVANASVTFAAPATGASATFLGSPIVSSGSNGVATAPPLTANSQTGTFQVTATTAAAPVPASFTLTNVAGNANRLVFVQQPVDTVAGVPIAPAVTVQLQDSSGNAVTTAGIAITLQADTSVRRLKQLSGTVTQSTDATGRATFADLSILLAGTYALQANSNGLSSAASNSFRITAGTAATVQPTGGTPQSATVLTPFTQQLQATVLDAFNNPVSNATVTFAAPGSGASATLSALTASTDANGIATVTATANSVAGGYLVTAGATGAVSANFTLTNVTGSAGLVSFVQQPSNTPAGSAISPPVSARITDTSGNPVFGALVTIRVQEASITLGGTLNGTTDAGGIATFADLSITTAGTYHLIVASGSLSTSSSSFQISAATSATNIITFQGEGQSAAVGTAYSGPLQARVEDAYHNPIANAPVTFTAPTTGASVTFSGSGSATITTGADGLATSPLVTANSQTGTFEVTASTAAASVPAAFTLTNVAGNANRVTFVQQPTDTVAGGTVTPAVTVQLQDSAGNPVHTAGTLVTLQANASVRRQKQISGSTTLTDSNGLATFANLALSQTGVFVLQADSPGLSSATSNTFRITAGTAASIDSTSGTPQTIAINTQFEDQLQVTVLDLFQNPVIGATVTFAAPSGSGASATLSATSLQTDANGHAAVTAIANSVPGSYSIVATTAGATGNASFALTNITGGVSQLAFVQQPSNTQAGVAISPAVTVHATDSASNPISGAEIAISLQGDTGTLGGTLTATTDDTGVATFSDLRITTAGSYQLAAVLGSLSAVSSNFQVSSSTSSAAISVFEGDGQSAVVGGPYGGPLKAKVQDLYGNPLSGVSVTFAAPSSGASATFAGTPTVPTGADGVAISPPLTANALTGTFQVTASTPGATNAIFTLTNLAGSANRLTFVQQPSDTNSGATLNPPVTVQVHDASGNAVHTAGLTVALQANAAVRKQLGGSTSQPTDANGLATFANLSISQAGSYTLQATSGGLSSATSNTFKITAGTPTSIAATGGTPQNAIVQTVFGLPLQATISDSLGNPISGVTVVFTAPAAGPSGLFGGQPTFSVTTDTQGHASAVITANSTPGTYGVTASSAAVTGSAIFTLTNLPPATSSLAFVQQPGNTAAGQPIAPPVTVQVFDSTGHPVSIAGLPIIMSLATGTGTLSGSLVQLTEANGMATFADLRIDQTGSKMLRAAGQEQVPADSNTFQVAAGPPANIVFYGGSPQATTIGQPFPAPLQALVTDAVGDPVSGVSVTFMLPATGPSGTFVGSTGVITGADGLATSSALVANSQSGNFTATAMAAGVGGAVQYALANLSQQTATLVGNPTELLFHEEIGQPLPPSQDLLITSINPIPETWTASSSASWLILTPPSGTTPGLTTVRVDPTGLTAGIYTASISLTSATGGVTVVPVTFTLDSKPTLVVAPPVLVFRVSSGSLPAPQDLRVTSSSRPIAYTVTVQVSTPVGGAWLKVSPNSGQTIGTATVTADPTGLAQGIYDGSVLFTPTESGVNSVAVPVTLVVGCGQGGCILQPIITAVVNGASFHPTGAPGAIMSIFGANFSDAIYDGSATYPLPTVLGRTSVTVNGFTAPLYFVSPTQINFQMPSTVQPPGGSVVVHNGSPQFRASSAHEATLGEVDPGPFVTPDKRASALNGDLSVHTPATPIPAGGYLILYLTGQGDVTPPIADGTAAPGMPLSIINGSVTVTIGTQNAQVVYKGLAPGFAGLAQLNVIVPAGLAPGSQTVFVTINGLPSNAGLITVK